MNNVHKNIKALIKRLEQVQKDYEQLEIDNRGTDMHKYWLGKLGGLYDEIQNLKWLLLKDNIK